MFAVWFEEAFNDTVVATQQEVSRLLQRVEIGDNQGDRVRLDWLGAVPSLRRWIGEKRARLLNAYTFTVEAVDWEATIEIRLNTLRDRTFNLYEQRIRGLAVNAARHPYEQVSDLVAAGLTSVCYDGQYFFDTDHAEGESGVQSNRLTGTGTSVAQVRADYFAAKSALMGFRDDFGRPMWSGEFRPLIWAPNSGPIMDAFETLRSEETLAISSGSQTNNTIRGKFDIIYDPRLTDANNWVMFNPDSHMKPFVCLEREAIHYVDNFGLQNPDVFNRRVGLAGVEGRNAYDYAMWQSAVMTTN